jgi:hypothetical protein
MNSRGKTGWHDGGLQSPNHRHHRRASLLLKDGQLFAGNEKLMMNAGWALPRRVKLRSGKDQDFHSTSGCRKIAQLVPARRLGFSRKP